jgi:hypothetical protein
MRNGVAYASLTGRQEEGGRGAGMPGAMLERYKPFGLAGVAGFLRHPATAAIVALGFTQIISWGTTLYALGVLGKPIAADTGWSQTLVFGGLTIGLLVSGAISASVGRFLDRRGGRLAMSLGSVLVTIGLVALSQVNNPYAYLLVWAFLGLAMRLTLYDAAFAALVQVTPSRGRRAISYLTMFGGLASTACRCTSRASPAARPPSRRSTPWQQGMASPSRRGVRWRAQCARSPWCCSAPWPPRARW